MRSTGLVRRYASRGAGLLGLAVALAACVPNATVPDPKLDVPSSYRYSDAVGGLRDHAVDWWSQFRSPELTKFMEETEVSNLSVAGAIGQLEQADAAARITGSSLFPFITASNNVTRNGGSGGVASVASTNTSTSSSLASSATSTSASNSSSSTSSVPSVNTSIMPVTTNNGSIGNTTSALGSSVQNTNGGGTTLNSPTSSPTTTTASTTGNGASSSLLTGSSSSNFVSSFAASYQLDLWGKNRAAFKAAQDNATASRWNRQTVQLTELATVANTYFNILAARERVRFARQDVVDSQRILDLIQNREKAGTATALNVAQQAALVANLRASIPPLEVIADQNVIALGILLGRTPQRVFVTGGSVLDGIVPRPSPGIRPRCWRSGRCRTRRIEPRGRPRQPGLGPRRLLPAAQPDGAGRFFQHRAVDAVHAVVVILFGGVGRHPADLRRGLLRGQFDQTKGQQDVLLANYRLTVITAFSDVDRALVGLKRYAEEEKYTRVSLDASRLALKLSEDQLKGGILDVVTLLQVEQTLFTTQDTLVQVRLLRLTEAIALYQALGGAYAGNTTLSKKKRAI